MRLRGWSVLLLAAVGCGGRTEVMAEGDRSPDADPARPAPPRCEALFLDGPTLTLTSAVGHHTPSVHVVNLGDRVQGRPATVLVVAYGQTGTIDVARVLGGAGGLELARPFEPVAASDTWAPIASHGGDDMHMLTHASGGIAIGSFEGEPMVIDEAAGAPLDIAAGGSVVDGAHAGRGYGVLYRDSAGEEHRTMFAIVDQSGTVVVEPLAIGDSLIAGPPPAVVAWTGSRYVVAGVTSGGDCGPVAATPNDVCLGVTMKRYEPHPGGGELQPLWSELGGYSVPDLATAVTHDEGALLSSRMVFGYDFWHTVVSPVDGAGQQAGQPHSEAPTGVPLELATTPWGAMTLVAGCGFVQRSVCLQRIDDQDTVLEIELGLLHYERESALVHLPAFGNQPIGVVDEGMVLAATVVNDDDEHSIVMAQVGCDL